MDEADRLLAQSFQDWLARVLAATKPDSVPQTAPSTDRASTRQAYTNPDALSPAFLHLLRDVAHVHSVFDEPKEASCQKLLFSATLTRDPAKIAALDLQEPKYFIVQSHRSSDNVHNDNIMDVVMEKYTMPATLKVRSSVQIRLPTNIHRS